MIDPGPALRRMPTSALVGGAVIAIGVALDLVVHLATPVHHHAGEGFGLPEHLSHLVVIAGMVIVLAAVVREGMRRASAVAAESKRSTSDAIR